MDEISKGSKQSMEPEKIRVSKESVVETAAIHTLSDHLKRIVRKPVVRDILIAGGISIPLLAGSIGLGYYEENHPDFWVYHVSTPTSIPTPIPTETPIPTLIPSTPTPDPNNYNPDMELPGWGSPIWPWNPLNPASPFYMFNNN